MIDIWIKLICRKARVITDVPLNMRSAVRARLAELGYDEDGDLLEGGTAE